MLILSYEPSLNNVKPNHSIINVSSSLGLRWNIGHVNYVADKGAVLVVGLTKTIAKEWGPFGVGANTVAFGLIHTRCVWLLLSPISVSN